MRLVRIERELPVVSDRRKFPFISNPAVPINQTAADSLTFTDGVTYALSTDPDIKLSFTDTLTFLDSFGVGLVGILNQTAADSLTFSDSVNGTFAGLTVQVSDTLTFVDNWNYLDVSVSDSFAITDQLMGMSIILLLNVSDTFAFTDGFQILDQDATGVDIYVPPLVDSLTFSDEIGSTVGIQVSDSDTLTLSDNVALTEAGSLVFSTTLTFLDSISVSAPSPSQNLSDFISLSDRVILQLVGFLAPAVGDAITFTDAVMIGLDLHQLTIADTLVFLDSTNQMMGYAPSFSDTITLTDSFNLNHGQNTAPSDTVGFTDSLQLDIVGIINLSFADGLILVDSVQDITNPPPTINLQFGDSVSFTDSEEELDQQVVYLIDLSDSLNLSDAIKLQNQDALSLFQDSIVFSDSIQIDLAGNLNTYLRRYLNDVLPN